MAESRHKKIYIIQFRTDASLKHEQDCYVEELEGKNIEPAFINAVAGELPETVPDDAVAIIMGGSGQYYLSEQEIVNKKWIRDTIEFADQVINKEIPLLGVCYGGHLLSYLQGADLTDDETTREVGTFKLTLLPDAARDPLFSRLEHTFKAQLGHKTTPINLPARLARLARSERVACQAFRVGDKPAWAVMFHPELNQERMRTRLNLFPEYVPKGMTLEELLKDFEDTPEAAKLLQLFVDYAIGRADKKTSAMEAEIELSVVH